MIKVNDRDFEWEEGLTVEKLLEKKRYVFPKIIVKVNGELIKKEDWAKTIINDGDDVKAIHVFGGG
ncbi:sulfur carrier protein ThiS [Paramaledivibacter caminithermalis]|jgi:sulfur carrier protein|uniref:Sulfur carrier protein n=1 Tax=Paramaledivibacter caminithermalis (strain DSM 15212 / CIP 107654 / DViRD3) TaxID=1121301 RepID=A0A1M6PSH5_PARC5|nr:sulfur carrier protein ThiS [Paramaledivibacter caminithermalis]SHK10886.1 sulfur carrier protein [Paramaledivibacter caminithermalis DSM 15212]